ncbi:MAG: class II aldolase/adducin family protein [Candidatus Hodarchaeales archaeon]|jgi:L-fuculose-phosphate aldolase
MLTAMGDVMREAYKRGWITTRDGNCSVRMKNRPYLYITPSGVRKTIIHPESIVKIKIENEELQLENDMNPSGELWMHWFLLRHKKETLSVLHLHPTHIVAAMYAGYNLCDIITPFPEVYRYTKVGPNVPAVQATSMDLAEQTYEKMCVDLTCNKRYDIIGQEGHGVCAIAKNPWDAFEHIERLEHICQIVLLSGNRSKLLS